MTYDFLLGRVPSVVEALNLATFYYFVYFLFLTIKYVHNINSSVGARNDKRSSLCHSSDSLSYCGLLYFKSEQVETRTFDRSVGRVYGIGSYNDCAV